MSSSPNDVVAPTRYVAVVSVVVAAVVAAMFDVVSANIVVAAKVHAMRLLFRLFVACLAL